MSVWYLELDDEITDAVARLRAAKDDRVVLVVPAGSRIGTGRINFRLLAREAASRDLRMALVSGDAQIRALAASAGLPTYASVGESERGAASEGPLKLDSGDTTADEGTDATATITTAPGPGSGVRTAGSRPVRRPRSRRRKAAMTVGALGLVVVVGGGTILALYRSVPTARITLALAPRSLGPVTLPITVSASEPTDPATGIVQGQLVPLMVRGSAIATATQELNLSNRARGEVTFTNASDAAVPIPDLTPIATASGIVFLTQDAIQAIGPGESRSVGIRAAAPGDQGNVDAGTITVLEPALAAQLGEGGGVSNPEPTTDGLTAEKHVFSQADYDAAVDQLTADLVARLGTAVPEPRDGVVAYPGTATRGGDVVVDQPAGSVVGSVGPQVAITGSMPARVLTASEAQVEEVAQRMLADAAAPDSLVPQPDIALGEPEVDGDRARYDATGTGVVYGLPITVDELTELVRSKTIAEAQAILGRYGTATITLSPDFLPALPDDPSRIEIRPEPPSPGATPIPSPSPTPAASASPGASGAAPSGSLAAPSGSPARLPGSQSTPGGSAPPRSAGPTVVPSILPTSISSIAPGGSPRAPSPVPTR